MSKAIKEMDSFIEKTIWRSRKKKKTKSLIDRETQFRSFRRSNLAKDTIKRIAVHTKLARMRYSDFSGNRTRGETKTSSAVAEKRIKIAQRRCRRRDKAFKAVVEEISKARSEASRGAKGQNIANSAGRKHVKTTTSRLQYSAVMNSEAIPNLRGAVSASLSKQPTGLQMLQTAGSKPLLTTTEHVADSDDKPQDRGHLGEPGSDKGRISDSATASSSQAGNKLSPLPLGPPGLATSTEGLPVWAQWYEPPLSAAQVDHVRKRMRLPTEYLSMGPFQRKKAVADDLSAAMRSMRQTFNQSIKFHWKYVRMLKQEFLRPQSDGEDRSKGAPKPMEARTIDTVSSKKSERLNEVGGRSYQLRPLRPKTTYCDNSPLLERTESSDHPSHGIRKIHLRRHGDLDRGSQGKAHPKRKDKARQLREDLSGRQNSSMARSSGIANPSIYNTAKTAMKSEPDSKSHRVSEKRVEKEMVAMNIPADTDMATDLRAYSQWPGSYEPR